MNILSGLHKLICSLLGCHDPHAPRFRMWMTTMVSGSQNIFRGFDVMGLTLTSVQEIAIGAQAVDAAGNPAPVDATVGSTWTVNPAEMGTLVDATNGDDIAAGAEKVFKSSGTLGTVQIMKVADADLSSAERDITAIWNYTVIAAEAVAFRPYEGAPRDQVFGGPDGNVRAAAASDVASDEVGQAASPRRRR